MYSNNSINITGNVGNDPRYNAPKSDSKDDVKRASLFFQVAVEPQPGKKDSENNYVDQDPYWVPCAIFGARAVTLAENSVIKSGQRLVILGSLRITKEQLTLVGGETTSRAKPLVVVENFEIMPTRKAASSSASTEPAEDAVPA